MSDTVIKVENLSKKFYLGMVQAGSIKETVDNIFNRDSREKDAFWALKDISFEVKRGDVLGIIGRNGAGKSTLLKILSRITPPTTGKITYHGRIASLLEVGTGFHGDLSGRENIYLNGTILGMQREEITRKLDEIIDFSGIEQFIDTPAKRYSSGMYVRLAFAVAAHLEPEIMIVDEVLAVGDVEFQKKCLGKMKEVSSKEGRTVLFVSHNMAAVQNLCNTAIYLKDGKVLYEGNVADTINFYLTSYFDPAKITNLSNLQDRTGKGDIKITKFMVFSEGEEERDVIAVGEKVKFVLNYKSSSVIKGNIRIIIGLYNSYSDAVARFDSYISNLDELKIHSKAGQFVCHLDDMNISEGRYYLNIALYEDEEIQDYIQSKCYIDIVSQDYFKTGRNFSSELAKILIRHQWEIR